MPIFLKSYSVVAVATEIVQSHIHQVSDNSLHTNTPAQNTQTQHTNTKSATANEDVYVATFQSTVAHTWVMNTYLQMSNTRRSQNKLVLT